MLFNFHLFYFYAFILISLQWIFVACKIRQIHFKNKNIRDELFKEKEQISPSGIDSIDETCIWRFHSSLVNALLLTLFPWWNSHPVGLTMDYFTASRSMSSFECWTFPLRPLWADWGETFSLERLILFHQEEQEQEAHSLEFQSTLFAYSLKSPEHLFLYCTISWIAGHHTLFSDGMHVISSTGVNLNPGSLFHILPFPYYHHYLA